MSDEDVIKRRLLIDGDGTGDDRRLNILLKTFIKWSYSSNDSSEESQLMLDRMFSQMTMCEYAFAKSRLMAKSSSAELENYKNLIIQISQHIEKAKQEIEQKKIEFKEAKTVRKNRVEYEVLANVINDQPDRKQTDEKLSQLKRELRSLEKNSEMLDKQLEHWRKHFRVLMASIYHLTTLLSDENDEGEKVENDEGVRVLRSNSLDSNEDIDKTSLQAEFEHIETDLAS